MNSPRSLANSCPYMRLTLSCAYTQALSQWSRSNQYLAANGRKVSKRYRRPWLWRCGGRPWVENGFAEPVSKILCTASLIRRGRRLRFAFSIGRRTFNADMEVIIMPIHRTNLGKPGSVSFGFTTKCFFDRRVDEDPLDLWLLCRRSNDQQMTWCPDLWIDIEAVGPHHHCR
jgi:hypothetical protein